MGPSNLSCVLIQRINSIPALSGGRVVGALNTDAESMLYEAVVSVMSRGLMERKSAFTASDGLAYLAGMRRMNCVCAGNGSCLCKEGGSC